MNIQLRRRRNQSLIQTPETTKHDARPFKVISTPTNFDFQLPPDSKLTVPNADLPSPIQPRKTSTTTRCVDTPLRRPEILTEDLRNRTMMSFALDKGADTGFSREKRRELRPTTATDKGFRDTRSTKGQGEVEKTMEDSFKQYLNKRMIERERLQTASLKVRMKEEEYRDEMRKKYEDEEKRRKMVLNKLFADKKGKIKSSQAERKEIHERQEQQRKDMIIANREKKKNLLAKLEKSEQNKKEADMRKTQKLSEWNSMIYERQQDRLERRDQKEEMFLSTLSVMWENKFDDPIDRKKRFLEERVYRSQKHSVEVEERYKKAKDESANTQTMYLQKVARKLMKVRSKSVMSKREIGNKEGSESDDEAKGEVIMKKNKQDEREKLKQLKEKEKLISERMKKRELDLQEYVSEKRDEWNLKLNNVRKNLEIASKDTERKIEHQIYSYKDRIESIKTSKLHRKQQLEYIDKAFLHGERSFIV